MYEEFLDIRYLTVILVNLPCKQEVSGSTPLSSTTVERLESLFKETVVVSFLFLDISF